MVNISQPYCVLELRLVPGHRLHTGKLEASCRGTGGTMLRRQPVCKGRRFRLCLSPGLGAQEGFLEEVPGNPRLRGLWGLLEVLSPLFPFPGS